jgi:hypothetical protein
MLNRSGIAERRLIWGDDNGMSGWWNAAESKITPISHGLHLVRHRGIKGACRPLFSAQPGKKETL